MADRLLVQNSVPIVDVAQPDGSTIPGIAIRGDFTIISQLPVMPAAVPVLSTTAYASGDALGGRLTFAGVATDATHLGITVDSIVIADWDSQAPQVDLVLFSQAFTATTDNAPFSPSDADLLNCVGVIKVLTASWSAFLNNSVASFKSIGLNVVLDGVDLYGQLVTRSAVTFTNVDALQVSLGIRRD